MAIIGHCHLRVGSELEPELGGSLYTALVISLAEIEKSHQYAMSGIYGYRIPDNEGMGLFTVQKDNFRLFFLCEGLIGKGLPFLSWKITSKLEQLFNRLEEITTTDHCILGHHIDNYVSFWSDLIYSMGFGNVPLEELEMVYPLQFLRLSAKHKTESKELTIDSLETIELGSLGFGWDNIDQIIAKKIQGIFNKPQYSFLIYEALFHQISEFVSDFRPNTIILSYQTGDWQESIALVAFLSLNNDELKIRYCLPLTDDLAIEGSQTVHSYLRSLFLDPL